ncbi:MAG: DUF721 domain-containing protein [Alphaproteobacteria bacterium]|nr:DUF721 domain-containing protein [Alphaproteobacteria bacterium]
MKNEIKINKEHTLNDLTNVAQTIMPLVKQILGPKNYLLLELLKNWQDIVGEDMTQYSLPQKITFRKNERTDGSLTLLVPSGAFAMEIQQKEQKILEKINAFLGYSAFAKIKILQNGNPDIFRATKKSSDKIKKILVSEKEQNYIIQQIKDINNPDLRDILEKLGKAVMCDNRK